MTVTTTKKKHFLLSGRLRDGRLITTCGIPLCQGKLAAVQNPCTLKKRQGKRPGQLPWFLIHPVLGSRGEIANQEAGFVMYIMLHAPIDKIQNHNRSKATDAIF